MGRGGPALLAALALAGATAAHAQAGRDSLVDTFRKFCAATAAEPGPALAAADGEGWKPVPDALLASFGSQFEKAGGRLTSSAGGVAFLVVGEQDRTEGGLALRMKACGVGGNAPDPAAVSAAVQAFAAVPRRASDRPDQEVWAYVDQGGRHLPLDMADPAALKAALAAGTARVVFAQTGPSPSPAFPGRLAVVILAKPTS